MKQRLRYLLAAGLVLPALAVAPVLAADNTSTTNTNNTSSTTTVNQNSSSTATDDNQPVDMNAVKQHIEQEKAQLKLKLTALEQQKILTKCVPAQAIIKGQTNHVEQGAPNRTKAYQELVDHINQLIDKLKAAKVDTTTLAQEVSTLKTKIATYQSALTDYKQALVDTQSVDCKTDPTGFKAALETARIKQQAVSAAVLDIRTYVTNTIKPTLVQIRTQLVAQSESSKSNATDTSGGSQ